MVKKIRPISRIVKIEKEINRILGEVFSDNRGLLGLDESWVPCVDIFERGNEIIVEVELPGVAQKDISILLYSNHIEIKGIKRENIQSQRIKYMRLERESGTFRRFIFLPSSVIPEKARALLENGVLTISLKKFRRKKEKEVVLEIQRSED